jgi:predicted DNA-binding transcriptional regulator AlpA
MPADVTAILPSDADVPLGERLLALLRESTDPPLLLDARQAWRLCGLSKSAFYRLLAADQLPGPIELPGVGPRWRRADLGKWAAKLRGRRRTPVPVTT